MQAKKNRGLVTRKAKAKYLPRIYANYFLQGQIEKTFLFELIEPTQERTGFGIINTDLKPTPAYYAIQNMISLLGEASWSSKTKSWKYPDFKAGSLDFTLKGNTTDIKHLLLQKSNGTFYLLLWQEVYVYSNWTGQDIVNADIPLTLQINDKDVDAKTYLLYNEDNPSSKPIPTQKWMNVSQLSLSVPDHILVVELKIANPSDIDLGKLP